MRTSGKKPNILKCAILMIVFSLAIYILVHTQSPANLSTDIIAASGFSFVGAIQATYNNVRRLEEVQLNLGVNAIVDLDLPSQSALNTYSEDKKAQYILNDESTLRLLNKKCGFN